MKRAVLIVVCFFALASPLRVAVAQSDSSIADIERLLDSQDDGLLDPNDIFEYVENVPRPSSLADLHSELGSTWISAYRAARRVRTVDSSISLSLRSRAGGESNAAQQQGAINNDYLGTPSSLYNRLHARSSTILVALLEQKRPWESSLANDLQGYAMVRRPFVSTAFSVDGVVIGNYSLAFGNGLQFGSGIYHDPQQHPTQAVEEYSFGVRGSLSNDPFRSFRGAAATVSRGPFQLTGFISEKPLDANILNDTIQTIYSNAYYRTATELSMMHSASLSTAGIHAQIANADTSAVNLAAGATLYRLRYSTPYNGTQAAPFTGRALTATSIDARAVADHLSASIEFASSVNDTNHHNAFTAAARFEPSQQIAFGVAYRDIPLGYIAPFGTMASNTNTNGVYGSLELEPIQQFLRMTSYASFNSGVLPQHDLFTHEKNDYGTSVFVTDHHHKLQASAIVRWYSDDRQSPSLTNGLSTYSTLAEYNRTIRFELQYDDRDALGTTSRYEVADYSGIDLERGWLLWQEARFQLRAIHTTLSANVGRFISDGSNAALYLYERGVPGSGVIASLDGRGWVFGGRLRVVPLRALNCALSIVGKQYDSIRVIGSGLTARVGRSDFQVVGQIDIIL